jgi:hypothetical protein
MERKLILTTPDESAFHRAFLEAMQNMAMVVAYAFGASYLMRKPPVVFGSSAYFAITGFLIYILALHAAVFTTGLFFSAFVERFPNIRRRKRLFFVLFAPFIMLLFFAMLCVPWIVTFKLSSS